MFLDDDIFIALYESYISTEVQYLLLLEWVFVYVEYVQIRTIMPIFLPMYLFPFIFSIIPQFLQAVSLVFYIYLF